MLKEFKEFLMRGNVVDLAVAVIIGGAFGKIVTSLVGDILMPFIGLFTSGQSMAGLSVTLKEAVMEGGVEISPAIILNYGNFLQSVIDFVIIGLCIFIIVKLANGAQKKISELHKTEEAAEAAAPPEPTKEELLLTEIRDLLKENNQTRS